MPCLLTVFAGILITGCTVVGPNYVRPETKVSTSWNSRLEGGLSAEEMDPNTLANWWITINDPVLTDLIERAKVNNLDIQNALARVRESRARRGFTAASLYPNVNVSGSGISGKYIFYG